MTSTKVQPLRKQPLRNIFNAISTDVTLLKQFRPVILLLSAISPYGIGVTTSADDAGNITYEAPRLSWKRPLSIYSASLLMWILFCYWVQISNIALSIPFPIHLATLTPPRNMSVEVTLMLSSNRLAFALVGLCRIFENVGLFLSAPVLVKWLNELAAIEIEFNTHFSRIGVPMNVNIGRLRNYLVVFCFILFGTLWITGTFWAFFPQYQFNPKYNAIGYLWYFSITFYLIPFELMEDVKIILMLEITRRMYSQVRNAIRQEVYHAETKNKIVVEWDSLITKLRRRVKLSGECIKTQLVLNTCETVFAVSLGTYLVIRSAGGNNAEANFGFAINSTFYCVFMSARFYMKVAIAESIYTEERLLVDELKDYELHFSAESSEFAQKLRNLQQSLMSAPSKVPIGGCCDLDSKLLVQVVIQIIPMLIAVAQFHSQGYVIRDKNWPNAMYFY